MRNKFVDFLTKYLQSNPDALLWIMSYIVYCHMLDDWIDGEKTDFEFFIKGHDYAEAIYANHFYIQNYTILHSLVKMAFNSYLDSIHFERSEIKWKKQFADVLRQNANEVILACIEIVNGQSVRRHASLELREISYESHHNELGQPI
ncbi:MAG TPA: hypothetical protein VF849_01495 [Blattabacteriaceae bacterium]